MLRASLDRSKGDPAWDLRKVEPYCGYETYQFDIPMPPFDRAPVGSVIGDCWHRYMVRMLEVVESIKLIRQGLTKYKTAQGSHRIEPPRHLPADPVGGGRSSALRSSTRSCHKPQPN